MVNVKNYNNQFAKMTINTLVKIFFLEEPWNVFEWMLLILAPENIPD